MILLYSIRVVPPLYKKKVLLMIAYINYPNFPTDNLFLK